MERGGAIVSSHRVDERLGAFDEVPDEDPVGCTEKSPLAIEARPVPERHVAIDQPTVVVVLSLYLSAEIDLCEMGEGLRAIEMTCRRIDLEHLRRGSPGK